MSHSRQKDALLIQKFSLHSESISSINMILSHHSWLFMYMQLFLCSLCSYVAATSRQWSEVRTGKLVAAIFFHW